MKLVDEQQELTRLLAEDASPLASSLGALRDRGPDAAELASLASRLALQGLDVSQPPRAQIRPHSWKKWGSGGLGGLAAVVVWLAFRSTSLPPPTGSATSQGPNASAASSAAPKAERASVSPPQAMLDKGFTAPVGAPVSTTTGSAAPSASEAPALGVETEKPPPSPASPSREVQSARGDMHATSAAGDAAKTQAALNVTSARATSTPSGGTAIGNGAPASPGSVAASSEIELLRDARLVLRQSPARALELTEQHARQYPQGKMSQERELIAVSALVALGRRAAALSRAASFERQYPSSPYRKQLGDLLR